MKHVIIGTAGHVDHGKSTLIRALTGTNPDRLKEEQERGMTIDIGFAALKLPDGTVAGIVDVPGHERFLKNMLAGASGVDVVLLVIAADEGVMPQTKEHLDILRILDVRNGVVALTKIDMVEKEWTDTVEEDVREQLAGTFLANSPIIRVSAQTGKGIEALKRALLSAVSRAEARNAGLPFRLPIDRVFTRPGFGTVVTGTLVAGTIRPGDAVEIVPQQSPTRVRNLQVHNAKVTEAEAGSRVAVNIAGIEVESVARGAQLAPPGYLKPTQTFDAVLSLLPDIPRALKDRSRVRLHLGTAEILGRVRLLDANTELEGGARAYVQFRGEERFACARGDRFVIRAYSPPTTLGGGIVLDTAPARHHRNDPDVLTSLASKERGTPDDLLETLLQRAPSGILKRDLAGMANLTPGELDSALALLLESGKAVSTQAERIFHRATLDSLTNRARQTLESYHKQFPLRPGMPKEELRAALGRDIDGKAFASLLAYWQAEKLITVEGATCRLTAFQVELNERQLALLARIEEAYIAAEIASPPVEDIVKQVRAPLDAVNALIKVGVERGRLVRVSDGVYYAAQTINELQQLVRDYVAEHGTITVAAFRDLTQSNRKFALQILEYFDQIRFTVRRGDERVLSSR